MGKSERLNEGGEELVGGVFVGLVGGGMGWGEGFFFYLWKEPVR